MVKTGIPFLRNKCTDKKIKKRLLIDDFYYNYYCRAYTICFFSSQEHIESQGQGHGVTIASFPG